MLSEWGATGLSPGQVLLSEWGGAAGLVLLLFPPLCPKSRRLRCALHSRIMLISLSFVKSHTICHVRREAAPPASTQRHMEEGGVGGDQGKVQGSGGGGRYPRGPLAG